MKKLCLLITCSLFTANAVFAQSLYEMDFHFGKDKNAPEYTEFMAFFLLNGDGTGVMRVLNEGEKPEDLTLLECEIKEGFARDKQNNIDYNKMYYTGKDISIIIGDTSAKFPPISFWFKLNKQTDEYEPWAVMTKDGDGKTLQGIIGDIRLLEEKDLTRELVSRYFTKDDEIYKNLFDTNIRTTLTSEQKASRMFFLIVADTEDENIGPDCQKDREKQLAYFKKIADKLQISFIPSELTGKELSRNNLLTKIGEINPTKNDIVIFHYSGHGYSKEDNRQFPYLDLRYDKDIPVNSADEINMEEVYGLIKNKPSRLNLVISDCCNWHLNASNMESANIANPRPSPVGLSQENMKALFMSPNRTSLMITAAAKGEVSAGNAISGGIFSSQFREALQKYMGINYQHITWEEITQNVKTQTVTVSGYSNCPKPENPQVIGACRQTPVFKMN